MCPETRVLYIAGAGRSGSTLIANILGQVKGSFSAGEVYQIWNESLVMNGLCSCGQQVPMCETWKPVLQKTIPGLDNTIINRLRVTRDKITPTSRAPQVIWPSLWGNLDTDVHDFLNKTSLLYTSIQQVTGCNMIIDSSKSPTFGGLLSSIPTIEVFFLHLVRDARAVAFSWHRRKATPTVNGLAYMPQFAATHAARMWGTQNILTETILKRTPHYLLMRYEDFVARPRLSIERILAFANQPIGDTSFISDSYADVQEQHSIAGNPIRFNGGRVAIRADNEWKSNMKPLEKSLVTMLTWPLLLRYGYL